MTTWRRAPRQVGVALAPLSGKWQPETLLAEVQQVWLDAVGEAIAREAEPVAERGGVVTISCSASVWAQELDLIAPTILERLNSGIRTGRVRRLRCTAAR
jgi:predicted nucleic acid-binding Zn ribbon protein